MAASISITALMALSDFDPPEVTSLQDLDADAATVTVVVLECRPCTGGYLLKLSDGMGGEATAFCPSDLMVAPMDRGSTITVTVMRSSGDPDFVYVQRIAAAATGKD